MPVTDPVADMLTRIRNGIQARHDSVLVPHSKLKLSIAQILKEQGYIRDFDIPRGQTFPNLRLHLSYRNGREPVISGLKRVSKPGLRVYVGRGGNSPRLRGNRHRDCLNVPRIDDRPASLADRHRGRVALLCLVVHSLGKTWKNARCPGWDGSLSPYPPGYRLKFCAMG